MEIFRNEIKVLDITVCILSYNRPDFLYECLNSVLKQTYQPYKIKIYDNASREDVYLKIKSLLTTSVEWIGSEINHGDRWNFNRAVSEISSKFVIVLHDDDLLCPNFLINQLEYFCKVDDLLAISANGYRIDKTSKRLENLVINGSNSEFLIFNNELDMVKHTLTSCFPMSPTIYLSEVFKKIKINETYKQYIDIILFLDISRLGKLAINLIPVYECRIHDEQGSGFIPIQDTDNLYKLYHNIVLRNNGDLDLIKYSYSNYIFSLFYNAIRFGDIKKLIINIIPQIFKKNFKFKFFLNILILKLIK